MNVLTVQQENNRREFVGLLRTNPDGLYQLTNGLLLDGHKGACALGVWAYHIGLRVDPEDAERYNYQDYYDKVEADLGIEEDSESGTDPDMVLIWYLNDSLREPFGSIASQLERRWFGSPVITADQLTENK